MHQYYYFSDQPLSASSFKKKENTKSQSQLYYLSIYKYKERRDGEAQTTEYTYNWIKPSRDPTMSKCQKCFWSRDRMWLEKGYDVNDLCMS